MEGATNSRILLLLLRCTVFRWVLDGDVRGVRLEEKEGLETKENDREEEEGEQSGGKQSTTGGSSVRRFGTTGEESKAYLSRSCWSA